MVLDRGELAARAVAARAALLSLCDSLAALTPVAPDAPATDPRRTVGAVVRNTPNGPTFIVVEPGEGAHKQRGSWVNKGCVTLPTHWSDEFVRWATREECERHGIPYVARPLPGAPVAAPSRPEWVRITGLPWEGVGLYPFTVGQACKVLDWRGRSPRVAGSGRDRVTLSALGASVDPANRGYATWEPCAAPSPAATPAAWVPSVGDVVTLKTPNAYRYVITGPVRNNLAEAWCLSASYKTEVLIKGVEMLYLGPATSAERAAAGLPVDESATKPVDREGLAKALHVAWWGEQTPAKPWELLHRDSHADWLRTADAAIAFLNGGAK